MSEERAKVLNGLIGNKELARQGGLKAGIGGDTSMYREAPTGPYGLTPKQTVFLEAVIEGDTLADAFRKAFDVADWQPKSIQTNASKLYRSTRIQRALSMAAHEAGQAIVTTTQSLTIQAREAFQVAKEKKNASAMIAAVGMQAKLHGLIIDRQERKIMDARDDGNSSHQAIIDELRTLASDMGITLDLTANAVTITDPQGE